VSEQPRVGTERPGAQHREREAGGSQPVLADAGFAERRDGVVSAEHAVRLAATLDADSGVLAGGVLPVPWHWACFLPDAPTAQLGPDGHPARRAEMAGYPNRMWVGGRVRAHTPLRLDRPASRASSLAAADRKEGATGAFWLLTVEHTVTQDGAVCVEERQDIALRAPAPTPAPGPDAPPPDAPWLETRIAAPPLLFRYSALTFNSHRIHYDHPYATGVEGYPDLVVQGPLTATLLCELARARTGAAVRALEFRARAPLFANRAFWMVGEPTDNGAELRAVRGDGTAAMTCTVEAGAGTR
jgi:hydroxyacyl-ACP dehydratase HTD2-like protein with hotdog domain